MAEKKVNTEKQSFFLFPEKLNTITIFFILLICVAIAVCVAAFALPKREYKYVPEGEEMLYSDKFNVYVKLSSNFTYENDTLSKKDTLVLYFKPMNSVYYQPEITKTNLTIQTKDDEILYYTPSTELNGYISALTQRTIYPNTTIKNDVKNIFFKIGYNLKDFTGDSPVITKGMLDFKETILSLSKNELDIDNCNGFKDKNDIFTDFYVKVVDSVDSQNNPKRNLKAKITLASTVIEKYHLDMQIFGVKDGKIYDIAGYYNLSGVTTPSTEISVTVPTNYNFDCIFAKAKFVDGNGQETNVIYKDNYESLIK